MLTLLLPTFGWLPVQMCSRSPQGRSPQDHTPYLEHEPIPGLGDTVVLPFIIIGWGAVVLISFQHLLQEEVGCEL